jgi:hypothetical protein
VDSNRANHKQFSGSRPPEQQADCIGGAGYNSQQ